MCGSWRNTVSEYRQRTLILRNVIASFMVSFHYTRIFKIALRAYGKLVIFRQCDGQFHCKGFLS